MVTFKHLRAAAVWNVGLGLILMLGGTQPCAAQTVTTILTDLEIQTPDTPFLRLQQFSGTGNPTNHAWELSGNEFEFALSDTTVGTVPLTIERGTPNDMMYLSNFRAGGGVGIGTTRPQRINGVDTISPNARHLNLNAGTGLARNIMEGYLGAEQWLVHANGPQNAKIARQRVYGGRYFISTLRDNSSNGYEIYALTVNLATGNVGVKTLHPTKPFQVGGDDRSDGNGAHVTPGGVWTNASSRTMKDDIQPITTEQARETVRALQPVGYSYKNEPEEKYVGFIAEDVPELVATNDRRSLASMDITAVLTRVVQDQDRLLDEERTVNAEQKRALDQQQQLIAQQQELLASLSKRLTDLEQKQGK